MKARLERAKKSSRVSQDEIDEAERQIRLEKDKLDRVCAIEREIEIRFHIGNGEIEFPFFIESITEADTGDSTAVNVHGGVDVPRAHLHASS